jgi:hypothetical protein
MTEPHSRYSVAIHRQAGRLALPHSRSGAQCSTLWDLRGVVVPPQSILPFHQAAASTHKQLLHYDGDVGLVLQHGGACQWNAHRRLWPVVLDWKTESGPRPI